MKNLIISGAVGLFFMIGGFMIALHLKPLPTPQSAPTAGAVAQSAAPAAPEPISVDTLTKTSETMMALNEALLDREQNVAEREKRVKQKEDEITAERKALDLSHEKFKFLFAEFQQRLQLVEANQVDQLHKQADLYTTMGTTQSIDLVRAMDDPSMVRLFSVMDTKPLAKMVAEWKTKYPEDTPRLLQALDGMAQVMPKDKIALTDPSAVADSTSAAPPVAAPDSSASPTPDSSTPAPAAPNSTTPDSSIPASTASDSSTPDSSTPAPTAPAATDSTPNTAPSTDPTSAPASAPPADSVPAQASTPSADSSPAPPSSTASN